MNGDGRGAYDTHMPLDLVLDDDGEPMHGPDCDVCDLFGRLGETREQAVRRLGDLYRLTTEPRWRRRDECAS